MESSLLGPLLWAASSRRPPKYSSPFLPCSRWELLVNAGFFFSNYLQIKGGLCVAPTPCRKGLDASSTDSIYLYGVSHHHGLHDNFLYPICVSQSTCKKHITQSKQECMHLKIFFDEKRLLSMFLTQGVVYLSLVELQAHHYPCFHQSFVPRIGEHLARMPSLYQHFQFGECSGL